MNSGINLRELFEEYLENDPAMELYFQDCINAILIVANNKGIEFDGYYQTRWENAAQDPVRFNEHYFSDYMRQRLYVYLSASVDPEIAGYLRDMYRVAQLPEPTPERIARTIQGLNKRVTF